MEQVADVYEQLDKQGRFSKKCIPIGCIPDLNGTKIHEDLDQPIRPVKQEEDPTETTTTPAAPTEIEEPQSSHLRSKTKQQLPPYSRDNWNAIHQQWIHQNAIQFKQRSTKCKLHQRFIL